MSGQPTPEGFERRLRPIRSPTARLISRLGTHLIETGQDLTALKEIVDDLGETQAKEMLTVSVANVRLPSPEGD